MNRNFSFLFATLFLAFATFSCGGDTATEEDTDNNGINISVEDSDGESVNINIDTDKLSNSLSDAMNQLSDAIEENGEDGANNLADAMEKMSESLGEAAERMNNGERVEVVNFRDLKAIIPDRLLGMDRTEFGGETTGALGFKVSNAEAEFQEDDKRLSVNVTDVGGIGMMAAAAAWTQVEVDRETSDGYERTTEIDGHKAYEKFNSRTGKAELALVYNNRFIISLEGRNLDARDLRRALNRIDYEDLE